jgi:hypothetical protein
MNQLSPHEAVSVASSLLAGMGMLQFGLRKKAIRWKTSTRCRSCGRFRRANGRCYRCT